MAGWISHFLRLMHCCDPLQKSSGPTRRRLLCEGPVLRLKVGLMLRVGAGVGKLSSPRLGGSAPAIGLSPKGAVSKTSTKRFYKRVNLGYFGKSKTLKKTRPRKVAKANLFLERSAKTCLDRGILDRSLI